MHVLFALMLLLQQEKLDKLAKEYDAVRAKPAIERYQVLMAIGNLKSDEAAAWLLRELDAEKDDSVRGYIVNALGNTGVAAANERLLAIAKDLKQPLNLRTNAISGLTRTKSKEALEIIKSILKDRDPNNTIRFSVVSSLNNYPLSETEGIWRDLLTDTQPTIVAQALRALAPLKDAKVLETARKIIEDPQGQAYEKTAAVDVWKVIGGPDMVKLFLTAAVGAEAALRKTITDALSTLKEEKEIEILLTGATHPEANVRALVMRVLATLKHDKAMPLLQDGLKDKALDVRVAAIESMGARKDAKSEEILQKQAQVPDEDTAAAAIGQLPNYPSKATIDLLIKLASKNKVIVDVAALDALGRMKLDEALPVFEKALKSKEWQVRAAAIRGLGKLKKKESVDLLIERLAKEDGRLLGDTVEALKALTGKALGYAPGHWKDWWKVNRDGFVFSDKTEGVGGAAGTTTYHGVPVLSKRIIFCLDISGSMSAKTGNETRLDQAKGELARVLQSLEKGTMVNMIFFDDKIDPWQKQLVPIKTTLEQAKKTVKELTPRGGTNIFDTLEAAFQDPNVDTIFLLSDGAPGSGKFTNTEDILREIKKMNRARQIAIHTISLGASDFMRRLAEENGGQYVEKK